MHGFTDLFLTSPFTSASRARVFLWIVWYYLEGATTPNPYAEAQGAANPKRPPKLVQVDDAERAQGINVDTPEELEWYEHKKAQRFAFLKELVRNEERDKRGKVLPDVLEIAATPSHRKLRLYLLFPQTHEPNSLRSRPFSEAETEDFQRAFSRSGVSTGEALPASTTKGSAKCWYADPQFPARSTF